MMRSLFSGVSGLKTHQVKMDVIGNNIANVNTTAYKSSSIVFSDLISQTTQKASGPNAATGTGGTNARQIGLGVMSGAINVNITGQGASQSTGNPFDIMITGKNFFVVSNGRENFFTRDGSFYVDGAGNLAMTSTGYNVMGWGVDDETGDIRQDTVSALRIMSEANMTYPPEATSKAYVSGILDKNDKDVTSSNGKTINLNFYDNLGYSYTARLTFKQSEDESNYSLELSEILDDKGVPQDNIAALSTPADLPNRIKYQAKPTVLQLGSGYAFNANGGLSLNGVDIPGLDTAALLAGTTAVDANGVVSVVAGQEDNFAKIAEAFGYKGSEQEFMRLCNYDDTTTPPTVTSIGAMIAGGNFETDLGLDADGKVTMDGRQFEGNLVDFDPDNGKFAGIDGIATNTKITLEFSKLGGNFFDIEVDLSDISMYDNKGTSTIGATSGDADGIGSGRRIGDMIGVSVQNNGMIYASYDNGMTKLLGQIATAEFPNASGLEKSGDNLYSATLNSGQFDGIGVDVTANGGKMSTGQLEMSNVDLSSEFTEMITTQRGFQANSRIITVSDTLLEELTNLKR